MDKKIKALLIIISIITFLVTLFFPLDLPIQSRIVLSITALGMILWISEAIQLHITALVVSFLLIVLGNFSTRKIFAPYFDPVVVLLLGGFILAVAMQKHGLDKFIASNFISKFGSKPTNVLFGVMIVTAFLSMWISNTASTAVMIPILLVILKANNLKAKNSTFGRSAVLGVAFAATLGGIGTPVGSTPNPIAIKFLADNGIILSFFDWMYYAIPFVIIFLFVIWFVLGILFKPEIKTLKKIKKVSKLSKEMKGVGIIFVITILLWLTTNIHGISSSVVSLVPIILLYLFGYLETKDFGKSNWETLILIGGGLSLGSAIHAVSLDIFFASIFESIIAGNPLFIIIAGVIAFAIILTMFTSNTAAAALITPIMIPLAQNLGHPIHLIVLLGAFGVSLDFILPVGTPPNAIAYSSGYVKVKEMMLSGTIIAILAIIILTGVSLFYW